MLLTHNTKSNKQIHNRLNTRAVRDLEAAHLLSFLPWVPFRTAYPDIYLSKSLSMSQFVNRRVRLSAKWPELNHVVGFAESFDGGRLLVRIRGGKLVKVRPVVM